MHKVGFHEGVLFGRGKCIAVPCTTSPPSSLSEILSSFSLTLSPCRVRDHFAVLAGEHLDSVHEASNTTPAAEPVTSGESNVPLAPQWTSSNMIYTVLDKLCVSVRLVHRADIMYEVGASHDHQDF